MSLRKLGIATFIGCSALVTGYFYMPRTPVNTTQTESSQQPETIPQQKKSTLLRSKYKLSDHQERVRQERRHREYVKRRNRQYMYYRSATKD